MFRNLGWMGVSFCLAFGSLAARATLVEQPVMAIACHFLDGDNSQRANGYDCATKWAARQGEFKYDDQISYDEFLMRRNAAFQQVAQAANEACGADCRYFYGTLGYQCLAVAQSERFTGLGAFTGQETTLADAEATATYACQNFVGEPGAPCKIIIGVCPNH